MMRGKKRKNNAHKVRNNREKKVRSVVKTKHQTDIKKEWERKGEKNV